MSGKVVGQRYQLVRRIGQGGMGSVHEAVDAVTRARVAVKLITAETARNPTLMGRFEREARAAATIDTPHIVKVLDAGDDPGSGLPFLVLEYLEGEDVQQLIRRLGPLPPDLALRIVAQACLGLSRAHEARIIHRDIKPANFFLASAGPVGSGQRVVKLLDFGIAKIAHDPSDSKAETAGLTRTGSMLGSPLYMSPEQARGHKDLDRRADLWSMGVVLYQALTGRTPHQDNDALGELIIAICTEEPPPIQELSPWVPPAVAAIAHRAMRFAPDERYQTADDMLDDIRPLLPEGWGIEDTMFRPLGDADRGQVQPRLVTVPDAPVGRSGRTHPGTRTGGMAAAGGGSATDAGTLPFATPFPAPAVVGQGTPFPGPALALPDPSTPLPASSSLQGFGTTVGSRSAAVVTPPPPPPAAPSGMRNLFLGVGAVVALGVGGAAAYRLMRADPPPAAVQSMGLTSTVPVPLPPTAEAKPRTVKVVVLPGDATVEVDGAPATPNDGTVEVTGPLASLHKVRVRSGDAEVLREVVVTENGAFPPKVELTVPASTGAKVPTGKAPGPLPKPSAAPPALPLRQQR